MKLIQCRPRLGRGREHWQAVHGDHELDVGPRQGTLLCPAALVGRSPCLLEPLGGVRGEDRLLEELQASSLSWSGRYARCSGRPCQFSGLIAGLQNRKCGASDACNSLCCVGLPLEAARTSSVMEGIRDAHSPIDVKQDALYKSKRPYIFFGIKVYRHNLMINF